MCYREILTHLTCGCKTVTVTFCPRHLEYEENTGQGFKYAECCNYPDGDEILATCLCEVCSEEYGLGTYRLGRDAVYDGKGKLTRRRMGKGVVWQYVS
jgi:hypothetical protein